MSMKAQFHLTSAMHGYVREIRPLEISTAIPPMVWDRTQFDGLWLTDYTNTLCIQGKGVIAGYSVVVRPLITTGIFLTKG